MAFLKKKIVIIPLILVIGLLIILVLTKVVSITENFASKYEDLDSAKRVEGLGRDNTYARYLEEYDTGVYPAGTYDIDIYTMSDNKNVRIEENVYEEEKVLISEEDGYVEWNVNVKEAGLYQMYLEYYPMESRGIDIERSITINGESPFLGAETITLSRIWKDKTAIQQDNRGNDIRPSQMEAPRWESSYFKDYMGYYTEPYRFYLQEGENTIRLTSVNEPLVLRKFQLVSIKNRMTYDEYIAKNTDFSKENQVADNYIQVVQGEASTYRSSPSLYASFDRSSPTTEPASTSKIRMNMTGGNQWRVSGQWIEWEVMVPEDGYYNLSIKGRQSYNRGFVSNRSLSIDGVIPFKEASVIPFEYSTSWNLMTLGGEKEAYSIPLTKGTHTVRLEVTLGELGDILTDLEESVFRLNEMYRKILILTGSTPDKYRDYRIDSVYPEVIEGMNQESKILYQIVDRLSDYSGQRGSSAASAQTLAAQLERFVERPDKIPKTLQNFKDNITALGTSILTLSEAPLDIDYIVVSGRDASLPEVKEGFIKKAGHEIKSFLSSFFEDYNSIGNVYSEDDVVTVWILSGRDQSNILKTMIDDSFTPDTGIGVNVKLISSDVLLPSVVAGTGPDIALTVGQSEPVNFALRSASVDLTQFEGFDELKEQYSSESFIPYTLDGGVYGVPETQNFSVLFYRKDILEELGIEIPNTWLELIKILPTIQKNNMNVGIPSTERKINNVSLPDLSNFFAQLYQRGGSLYNEEATRAVIDTDVGVEAFEAYTMFFTHYKTPTVYDFVNRFRTGEMPLGIADYNTFNTLSVFAPEIRGLWGFTLLPGVEKEDGTIDRSENFWGNASMMLSSANNQDNAWTFLRWWADSTTQVRFGRELESVMGASARYATANKETFEQLAWSSDNSDTLKEQWNWVVGTPEVPGGYYTSRHIVNAIRKVINKNEDARETLLDYTRTINDELEKKRIEFGLENVK